MDVVIIGAGRFGREVLHVLDDQASTDHRFIGFIDDGDPDRSLLNALGEQLLGDTSVLEDLDAGFLVGVGNPRIRRTIDERVRGFGRQAVTVAHRSSTIGRRVELGDGSVICPHAALTTNIAAGRHLHVNLGATIGHDCVIGDFVTLAPSVNISGNVTIGDEVEFGTGAKVLPGLTIGAGAVVGAGAVCRSRRASGCDRRGRPGERALSRGRRAVERTSCGLAGLRDSGAPDHGGERPSQDPQVEEQ